MCCLSQSVIQLQPVFSYIFSIKSSKQQTISNFIPHQSFSLFVTSFLHTVSDQTANVALNSNGRYKHYLLITFHNFVCVLMFWFLHSQLHITNMKTLFASHVKPWPVLYFPTLLYALMVGMERWVWRSVHAICCLTQYLLNVILGGPQGWSGNVAGMKDIFISSRISNSSRPVVQPLLQLLYRLIYPQYHIWVYFLTQCVNYFQIRYGRKLVYVNCMTSTLSTICAFYQTLSPLPGPHAAALTDVIWGLRKHRFSLGRKKISER